MLPIYTDNNLQQVGQKVGKRPSLESCIYTSYIGVRTNFLFETTVLRMRSAKVLTGLDPLPFYFFFFLFGAHRRL